MNAQPDVDIHHYVDHVNTMQLRQLLATFHSLVAASQEIHGKEREELLLASILWLWRFQAQNPRQTSG